MTLYTGDGQASTSDFLSPTNAVLVGVFGASAFSSSGGLDVTAAARQLRPNAGFIGVEPRPVTEVSAQKPRNSGEPGNYRAHQQCDVLSAGAASKVDLPRFGVCRRNAVRLRSLRPRF